MEPNTYSRNQCSIIIRVDDESIELPINFGLTADEIRTLYPFMIDLTTSKVGNPAIDFSNKAKMGQYDNLSDKEYGELVNHTKKLSKYWYDKGEASLLEIAMRIAVDIKLKGIDELRELFEDEISVDNIKYDTISSEEADTIVKDMNLESPIDSEHDPGDEQDIPLGIAGGLNVNLYASGEEEDYLSQELDEMESKLDVDDKFSKIIDSDLADVDESKYKSEYKAGAYDTNRVKDGLLDMYSENNESKTIFDKMDEEDGLFAGLDEEEVIEEDYDDEEVPYEEDDEIGFDDADADVSDEEIEQFFSAGGDGKDDE